jgi:hypothetical protein
MKLHYLLHDLLQQWYLIRLSRHRRPCAYCGARPAFPVIWQAGKQKDVVFLCSQCDAKEVEELYHGED